MANTALPVRSEADVERVRHAALDLASQEGFEIFEQRSLVLAVSELATNTVRHAGGGEIVLSAVDDDLRGRGVRVECLDHGPGIKDVEQALRDGFSTSGSLGGGLGVARRQMDDLEISTGAWGTRIVAHKWLKTR